MLFTFSTVKEIKHNAFNESSRIAVLKKKILYFQCCILL